MGTFRNLQPARLRPASAKAASLPVTIIDKLLLTEQANRESATVMVTHLSCSSEGSNVESGAPALQCEGLINHLSCLQAPLVGLRYGE